jgi:hypothetical protein
MPRASTELRRIDSQLKRLASQIRLLDGIDRELYLLKVNVWLDARNRATQR